ncbi:4-hydroxybenzoate octaprenyltransferase, partial [bacterium M00.F.Ca.ET.168.01.1.1]
GLAFSWGALMGWAVEFGDIDDPAIMLYIGSILWVIGYDTIYAHQDKEDDAIVGVRATARLFGDNTKMWLTGLYGGALVCFAIAFASAQVPVVA